MLAQGTGHQGTRELGGGMLAQGTGIWYWKNGDLDREAGQAALPPVGSPCFLAVSYLSFSLFESLIICAPFTCTSHVTPLANNIARGLSAANEKTP